LERGEWHQEQFPENPQLTKGLTQDYFGVFKAFLPSELRELLERAGMRVLRLGGLGCWPTSVGRRWLSEFSARKPCSRSSWSCTSASIGRSCRRAGDGAAGGLIAVTEPLKQKEDQQSQVKV
jgi:hypothetical protein